MYPDLQGRYPGKSLIRCPKSLNWLLLTRRRSQLRAPSGCLSSSPFRGNSEELTSYFRLLPRSWPQGRIKDWPVNPQLSDYHLPIKKIHLREADSDLLWTYFLPFFTLSILCKKDFSALKLIRQLKPVFEALTSVLWVLCQSGSNTGPSSGFCNPVSRTTTMGRP